MTLVWGTRCSIKVMGTRKVQILETSTSWPIPFQHDNDLFFTFLALHSDIPEIMLKRTLSL